jgi:hypothetical protein
MEIKVLAPLLIASKQHHIGFTVDCSTDRLESHKNARLIFLLMPINWLF